jgi:Cu2+-exporting ATPase
MPFFVNRNNLSTMTHTYKISGMTCQHCEANVQRALTAHPEVTKAEVSRSSGTATVTLKQPVAIEQLQALLSKTGLYQITES